MKMTKPQVLSDMRHGAEYVVHSFTQPTSAYADKLRKMGFTEGTVVCRAPIAISDPMIVLVRGSQIALRKSEASNVLVEARLYA